MLKCVIKGGDSVPAPTPLRQARLPEGWVMDRLSRWFTISVETVDSASLSGQKVRFYDHRRHGRPETVTWTKRRAARAYKLVRPGAFVISDVKTEHEFIWLAPEIPEIQIAAPELAVVEPRPADPVWAELGYWLFRQPSVRNRLRSGATRDRDWLSTMVALPESQERQRQVAWRLAHVIEEISLVVSQANDAATTAMKLWNTTLETVFNHHKWPQRALGEYVTIDDYGWVRPVRGVPSLPAGAFEPGMGCLKTGATQLGFDSPFLQGMVRMVRMAEPGNVVLAGRDSVAVVHKRYQCSQSLTPMRVQTAKLLPGFIVWSMLARPLLESTKQQYAPNFDPLLDHRIGVPSPVEQVRVDRFMQLVRDDVLAVRNVQRETLDVVSALKDAVLSAVMRGEL